MLPDPELGGAGEQVLTTASPFSPSSLLPLVGWKAVGGHMGRYTTSASSSLSDGTSSELNS